MRDSRSINRTQSDPKTSFLDLDRINSVDSIFDYLYEAKLITLDDEYTDNPGFPWVILPLFGVDQLSTVFRGDALAKMPSR